MAEQRSPVKRLVALKLIKAGMDSKMVLARFEAERQALALMDHPNIARILDGGITESGSPYFVMELVKGVPITEYCDAKKLTPQQRLELFVPVCQAIQHAHQKGIIHRDIKPSNVMVSLYDDKAVPKVIDFGVAKATGQALRNNLAFDLTRLGRNAEALAECQQSLVLCEKLLSKDPDNPEFQVALADTLRGLSGGCEECVCNLIRHMRTLPGPLQSKKIWFRDFQKCFTLYGHWLLRKTTKLISCSRWVKRKRLLRFLISMSRFLKRFRQCILTCLESQVAERESQRGKVCRVAQRYLGSSRSTACDSRQGC